MVPIKTLSVEASRLILTLIETKYDNEKDNTCYIRC